MRCGSRKCPNFRTCCSDVPVLCRAARRSVCFRRALCPPHRWSSRTAFPLCSTSPQIGVISRRIEAALLACCVVCTGTSGHVHWQMPPHPTPPRTCESSLVDRRKNNLMRCVDLGRGLRKCKKYAPCKLTRAGAASHRVVALPCNSLPTPVRDRTKKKVHRASIFFLSLSFLLSQPVAIRPSRLGISILVRSCPRDPASGRGCWGCC